MNARRSAWLVGLLACLFTTSASFAAPAATASPAQPGVAATPSEKPPPAHPPTPGDARSPQLPVGHPGTDEPPPDTSSPSVLLAPGSITASIVDPRGAALANVRVRLGIMFQRIAEGESHKELFTQADANGVAHFSGLNHGSDYAYRVTVQRGPALYSSAPFNLRQDMGQRVLLHVYPSTNNVNAAMIGIRGYLYIETREDVFQCEVLFRVFNVGSVTWVPNNVVIRLPPGFKAFKAQQSMTDVRAEQVDGVGAKLEGTFSPGQNEVSFRFQVPKNVQDTAVFQMTLPPHVAEMRVIAEASSSMNLDVTGFDRPVPAANNNGQRVLVAVKQTTRRDDGIKGFVATLSGIPVPGPGRWVAVLLALGLSIGGVFGARGAFDDVNSGNDELADKKKARELLLNELVELQAARRANRLGQRAYQHSHEQLIDAIARLGLQSEAASRASKKSGPGTRNRPKRSRPNG